MLYLTNQVPAKPRKILGQMKAKALRTFRRITFQKPPGEKAWSLLFDSHIRPILDQRKPATLLEIGVLRGDMTLPLLEWCSENGAHLTSLDPIEWDGELPEEVKRPRPGYLYKRGQLDSDTPVLVPTALEEVFRRGLDKHWTCLKTRSLEYFELPEFQGFDLYLIDGDHNHYSVSQELASIHRFTKPGDAVLLNDVVGVWARRDLYYDPELIPNEFKGRSKQGVLTAIQDFLSSVSERQLFWRKNCPYTFRIMTKDHYGLGLLTRVE